MSGDRFITLADGRKVPCHSGHGDQPQPGPQHANSPHPPEHAAPVAGKEGHNHPEAREAANKAVAEHIVGQIQKNQAAGVDTTVHNKDTGESFTVKGKKHA